MFKVKMEEQNENNKTVYEVSFLFVPMLTNEEVVSKFSGLKSFLEKAGAEFISEEAPRVMDLAYTMNRVRSNKNQKFNQAFFGWVKFDLVPDMINAFKKMMDTDEDVIRFLIIKTVRENTMFPKKPTRRDDKKGDDTNEEMSKSSVESDESKVVEEINKEEIDKKIEELGL